MPQNPNFGDSLRRAAQAGRPGGFRQGRPQGVRYKKGQTLGGALAGVFVGILLVAGSPFVLWQAETQHTAKDFQAAEQVEAESDAEGYITFQGTPEVNDPLACVEEQEECLYYSVDNQELKTIQEEQCGNVSDDAEILYSTVLECDEDGNNCQQCYMVERDVWETLSTVEKYSDATVGSYTIEFNNTALMLGLEETIIEHTETTRDVWTYFTVPTELRVAGNASNQHISGADTTYVLSVYGYEKTLSELEARDATNKWLFRIITFVMLLIGFASILGPLSYFAHVMRKIPFIGPFIKEGGKFIVGLISFVLAVVTFIMLWIIVSIIKNIFVVVGLLLLIIIGFVVVTRKRAKAEGGEVKPS